MPTAAELRQLDSNELFQQLEAKREELFRLRLNWAAGSLEDPNQIKRARHEMARILTIMREREIAHAIVAEEAEEAEETSEPAKGVESDAE